MDAYVGSMPIAALARPIIVSEMMSMFRRPTRSPKCPNSTAPNGRAKNPAPNVANEASVAAVSDRLLEKKRLVEHERGGFGFPLPAPLGLPKCARCHT